MTTPKTMPPRAILWDMDGVLIDSGPHHFEAWREILARECGRDLTAGEFRHTFGMRNDTMLRSLFGPDFPPEAIARLSAVKEQRFRELVRGSGIDLLPGAREWLERARADGWRQALASSAPRDNIDTVLDALGLRGFFDAVVAAEDVTHGKPHPEPFVQAAGKLGVPPERCIVIEDSPAGVEAARRAGIACLGVLTTHPRLDTPWAFATLRDTPPAVLETILAPGASEGTPCA